MSCATTFADQRAGSVPVSPPPRLVRRRELAAPPRLGVSGWRAVSGTDAACFVARPVTLESIAARRSAAALDRVWPAILAPACAHLRGWQLGRNWRRRLVGQRCRRGLSVSILCRIFCGFRRLGRRRVRLLEEAHRLVGGDGGECSPLATAEKKNGRHGRWFHIHTRRLLGRRAILVLTRLRCHRVRPATEVESPHASPPRRPRSSTLDPASSRRSRRRPRAAAPSAATRHRSSGSSPRLGPHARLPFSAAGLQQNAGAAGDFRPCDTTRPGAWPLKNAAERCAREALESTTNDFFASERWPSPTSNASS